MDLSILTYDIGMQLYADPIYGRLIKLVRLLGQKEGQDKNKLEIDVVAAVDDKELGLNKLLKEIASEYNPVIIFHQHHPSQYKL